MPMVMSSITWLCLSGGSKAMALPRRLGQGDGADVHRVRHPEAHGDVERGDRAVGLDDRGGRRRHHVGEPRRRGELAQERGERLDVHRAAGDPDADLRPPRRVRGALAGRLGTRCAGRDIAAPGHRDPGEPGVGRQRLGDLVDHVRPDVAVRVDAADDVDLRDQRVADALGLPLLGDHRVEAALLRLHLGAAVLGHPQPRALRDEPQQPAPDHDQRGRARREQPRVLDARKQTPEVGQRELEARAAGGCLPLLPGKQVDFDHAARLSARPTESIKRGAISSTATDSKTESRTLSRCTGLASSTGTRSRFDNVSFRPGTPAPPPLAYTRPSPPAERDALPRHAAAPPPPTAIPSPRASTYCARSALWAWPWMTRSESSADSPFSRWRSSRNRRVPTERSRVSTRTPSSRMFTLVISCPMLTSPTTPCSASGWFSSKALWIANASTSMIAGSSPASPRSEVRLSTSSRLAATSSTFICSPSASGSRIWKSSSTLAMSKGTCCSASHRITSRASASFIRSIWIFLTITSRPPTAVTTDRCLTPAAENSPRMASDTRPGSMTSPSTMPSAATSGVATLTSSGSLPEWPITASLMMPDPISMPTEGFLPPSNPKRAIGAYGLKKKMGRGQTTVSPAPYPVKPRTYLRPNQQVLWLPRVRPL